MSAFIVPDVHINYLLNYAANEDVSFYVDGKVIKAVDRSALELLGRRLKAANVRSVNYRYKENEPVDSFKLKIVPDFKFDPVQVLKACSCFDYQSCEIPEYDKTEAAKVIDTIRSHAIGELPGYDKAEWVIGG